MVSMAEFPRSEDIFSVDVDDMSGDSSAENKAEDNILEYIRQYLSTGSFTGKQEKYIKQIPWNDTSCPEIEIENAKKILDDSHFGMKSVKQQILRYLACQKHLGTAYGDVLLLVGPPGVGKTSIAKAIATAMNRPFIKIPLAGVNDAGSLRGYDTNYKDPKPGLIVEGIIKAKTMCPLILLDEIDKLGESVSNGSPQHVLLHILDSDRTEFVDDMIGIPIDISNIVFVATANSTKNVSPILLNRFEIINLNGYTRSEKIKIATDYIIPDLVEEYKVENFGLNFTSDLIEYLVDQHAHDFGVRSLKRSIKMLIESIIMIHYTDGDIPTNITISDYMRVMQIDTPKPKTKAPLRKHSRKSKIEYNY